MTSVRILFPALGCPAVISPRADSARGQGGVQRRITVLLVSDRERLTPVDAAAQLRIVAWAERAKRHAPATFAAADLHVRSDVPAGTLTRPQRDDRAGGVVFGADRQADAVAASLSDYVRGFYAAQGLRNLHEITVSEQACARLSAGTYHLFWEVPGVREGGPSAELTLLADRFARPRREGKGRTEDWRRFHRDRLAFLVDEYRYEYADMHPAPRSQRRHTEVLHPVVVQRPAPSLKVAHVTDVHVDTRMDVYEHNLRHAGAGSGVSWDGRRLSYRSRELRFNNTNRSFSALYEHAKGDADVIVMTGDLIEYGRGHVGLIDGGAYRRRLGDDQAYHADRNWFLFYDLLAGGDRYRRPVYTTLGNHDWRLNPYAPFAPGATSPPEIIHNYGAFAEAERRQIVELAHGPGHDRTFYVDAGPDLVGLFRRGLSFPGSPLETSIESVAWYLLLINPFLDYALPLPGGQQLLMLDWGEAEDVSNHSPWAFDYGTPSEQNVLSPLQRWHVEQFARTPGVAKMVGKHAPVLGPFPTWTDEDLARGDTTYTAYESRIIFADLRPPIKRHTLCAIPPHNRPRRVAATYASMMQHRDWLIQRLAAGASGVRLVLSGHIHRAGLLVAYPASNGNGWLMKAVRYQHAPGYSRARSPLYVNTASAGPRPNRYADARAEQAAPGFHVVTLTGDGAIASVHARQLAEPNQLPAPRPQSLVVETVS